MECFLIWKKNKGWKEKIGSEYKKIKNERKTFKNERKKLGVRKKI